MTSFQANLLLVEDQPRRTTPCKYLKLEEFRKELNQINHRCVNDEYKFAKKISKRKHAVTCGDIHKRFKEYAVITSDKEVKESIERCQNEPIEAVKFRFKLIYHSLTQYSDKELNEHFEEKNQKWQDWCNDVILFYVHRFIIFEGKLFIPIMELPEGFTHS